jgi:hypothetical protein
MIEEDYLLVQAFNVDKCGYFGRQVPSTAFICYRVFNVLNAILIPFLLRLFSLRLGLVNCGFTKNSAFQEHHP